MAGTGWGELPANTAFDSITGGTPRDLAVAASLVRVTRYQWQPGAGLGGFCFDLYSGGPQILLDEEGNVRVLVDAPSPQASVQPVGALPLLSHAGVASAPPVVVAPTRGST